MGPLDDAILHCFKYSGQDVYGLLLSSSGDVPTHCIPLFHTPCVSSPLIRTALSIVESCSELNIAGIYFATNGSSGVTPVAKLLHSTILATRKEAAISLWRYNAAVGGDQARDGTHQWPFSCYIMSSDKEFKTDMRHMGFDAAQVKDSIQQERYVRTIVDFEDFMNDPKLEWIKS